MVQIVKYDNLHIKIETENYDYLKSVREYFSDFVEGYQFMPAFTNSGWDGKVSMFNTPKRTLPYGLLIDLLRYHKQYHQDFPIHIDPKVIEMFKGGKLKVKENLSLKPHDYQLDCVEASLHYKRGLIRSATASGKSLIIAYILKTLFENKKTKKALIIVPTISLVEQFYDDLLGYGYFTKKDIGRVYEKFKQFENRIVIATWQTLSKYHPLLAEFTAVICDETHGAKAYEIKKILQKCTTADYRLGFTGTLPELPVDLWNVKSFLGPIIREYGAGELGDQGYISKCNIVTINLQYAKEAWKGKYDEVKTEVFQNKFRLSVIKHIVKSVNKNILLLVGKVEDEGQLLKNYLDDCGKTVVFLWGKTKVEDREYWRKECEKRNDVVIIATYGIFQLGINIPSLKYIILASPFKSKIRVLQSVGRSLRKHSDKMHGAYVFDIFDNYVKYIHQHGLRRAKYYQLEQFNIIEIVIEEGGQIELPYLE